MLYFNLHLKAEVFQCAISTNPFSLDMGENFNGQPLVRMGKNGSYNRFVRLHQGRRKLQKIGGQDLKTQ